MPNRLTKLAVPMLSTVLLAAPIAACQHRAPPAGGTPGVAAEAPLATPTALAARAVTAREVAIARYRARPTAANRALKDRAMRAAAHLSALAEAGPAAADQDQLAALSAEVHAIEEELEHPWRNDELRARTRRLEARARAASTALDVNARATEAENRRLRARLARLMARLGDVTLQEPSAAVDADLVEIETELHAIEHALGLTPAE